MTNNSYYDDIALVNRVLLNIKEYKELNDIIYESYEFVEELNNTFSIIAKEKSPLDEEFITSYNNLTEGYIALESLISKYDKDCKTKKNERTRVKRLSYLVLDVRSSIIKYKLFLNTNVISPESVSVVNRLWKESKTIGFVLTLDEKDVLTTIENYVNSI